MKCVLHRLQRRLLDERGYSLVELIIVLTILAIVLGTLTTVFVTGTRAELDLNKRFQAQQNVRIALDKIRRETHCASSATVTAGSVTLVLPSGCPSGTGPVTWCTGGSGLRWALYRELGGSCSSTSGVKKADYLTTGSVFGYLPQSASSLAKLTVDFPVDIDTSSTSGTYRLSDALALRNSTRA
jgi:prepilin-type N-terminal cleavage/methylation domain-containing protein